MTTSAGRRPSGLYAEAEAGEAGDDVGVLHETGPEEAGAAVLDHDYYGALVDGYVRRCEPCAVEAEGVAEAVFAPQAVSIYIIESAHGVHAFRRQIRIGGYGCRRCYHSHVMGGRRCSIAAGNVAGCKPPAYS